MKYDRSEAIRYMGGRAGDENAGVLADLAYLKLRNEVQARSVYRVLDCSVDADGVLHACRRTDQRDLRPGHSLAAGDGRRTVDVAASDKAGRGRPRGQGEH